MKTIISSTQFIEAEQDKRTIEVMDGINTRKSLYQSGVSLETTKPNRINVVVLSGHKMLSNRQGQRSVEQRTDKAYTKPTRLSIKMPIFIQPTLKEAITGFPQWTNRIIGYDFIESLGKYEIMRCFSLAKRECYFKSEHEEKQKSLIKPLKSPLLLESCISKNVDLTADRHTKLQGHRDWTIPDIEHKTLVCKEHFRDWTIDSINGVFKRVVKSKVYKGVPITWLTSNTNKANIRTIITLTTKKGIEEAEKLNRTIKEGHKQANKAQDFKQFMKEETGLEQGSIDVLASHWINSGQDANQGYQLDYHTILEQAGIYDISSKQWMKELGKERPDRAAVIEKLVKSLLQASKHRAYHCIEFILNDKGLVRIKLDRTALLTYCSNLNDKYHSTWGKVERRQHIALVAFANSLKQRKVRRTRKLGVKA